VDEFWFVPHDRHGISGGIAFSGAHSQNGGKIAGPSAFFREEMMKKAMRLCLIAILALLSISVFVFPGTPQASAVPEGFLGVAWGANTEQIIKAMKERGFRQLTGTNPGRPAFKGSFAGSPCQLSFGLMANSFYNASANFCARSDTPTSPQFAFRRIVDDLSGKYGPPTERVSDKLKTNDGKEHPKEYAKWDIVDGKTSDKYIITVDFGVTWFADDTGDQYVVNVTYWASSLGERLKKSEY
jgi:hypothetical protein